MELRTWTFLVLSAAALSSACSSTPAPESPSQDIPEPVQETPDPPKPKPCEALEEKCESGADTRAKIAKSSHVIHPINGWTYAQGADATVSQHSADGAALAIAEVETGTDAKQEPAKRDEAVEELAKQIGVTVPKKKVTWKKPLEEKAVGDLKIGLWQIDGAARGDKKGPLLIFAGPTGEGKVLLGIGFVPEDDSTGSDASILESIDSIAVAGK
ncbi:hypothetical protein [Chondromyces crocatus]|uniref:Uncharacterized protein n=1 Tax=Chondromyces crocatus TaxID=52 RepID=A0A0K1EG40_CHOCO|nr:hypothetical protein [Chondromyces crocatus]AKT39840.1 uncharacterized protein CMC5_039910 [Chondromyces crocatus]